MSTMYLSQIHLQNYRLLINFPPNFLMLLGMTKSQKLLEILKKSSLFLLITLSEFIFEIILVDGPGFSISFLRIEYKHQNRNLKHVKIFWKLEKWGGLKNGAIWQEDITGTDWILLVWWPRGHRAAGQSWNLQNSSAFLIQKSTKITLAYCCVIHECFLKFNALPLKYYKVTSAQSFLIITNCV